MLNEMDYEAMIAIENEERTAWVVDAPPQVTTLAIAGHELTIRRRPGLRFQMRRNKWRAIRRRV